MLSNALKYTEAGEITIEIKEPKTLCILDTGIGIAPEDLPRIFLYHLLQLKSDTLHSVLSILPLAFVLVMKSIS